MKKFIYIAMMVLFLASCSKNTTNTTAHIHNYEVESVFAPTCASKGYTKYRCSCGETYEGSYVDVLPHTIVIDERVEPEDYNDGLTEGSHCSVCGKVIENQYIIPALISNKVLVSFDSDGGSEIEAQSVSKGHTVEKPSNPTKLGYSFEGWYYNDEPWSFVGYVASQNFTLKAKWSLTNYTLRYLDTDGSELASQKFTFEDSIEIDYEPDLDSLNPDSLHYGYEFSGWRNENGLLIQKIEKGTTNNVDLYLIDKVIRFKITYNLNGGSLSRNNPSAYTVNNSTIVLGSPTKDNYHFIGWSNGGVIPSGSVGDITVTAIWASCLIVEDGVIKDVTDYFKTLSSFEISSNLDGETITRIDLFAFQGCTSLTSITIPDSVKEILPYAFSGCSSLTSITLSNGITKMYGSAFSGCTSLSKITIPNSVIEIGNNAFKDCTSLSSIVIPDSVTNIGNNAFQGCTSLSKITIPNSVIEIGNNAFKDCTSLSSIVIPDSVTNIGNNAFQGCISLTEITIPNSVTSIGDYAFDNCPIEKATIPYLVLSYINKGNLKELVLTSGTSIEEDAFYKCSSLTSITIPNSVTSIDRWAFDGCSSLKSITIPNSVTSIGDSAFYNCYRLVEVVNLSRLNITKGSTDNGYVGYNAVNIFNSIDQKKEFKTEDDFLIYDNNVLVSYLGNNSEIAIPSTITSIGNYAFYNNDRINTVTIPESVTYIGSYSFRDCTSLTSITIPNGVKTIGDFTFYNCSSLTSITIPYGVTTIGTSAFYYCASLTSITIPDSVTSIGNTAFRICSSLTTITISSNVTSIGSNAFYNCKNLKTVINKSSLNITKGSEDYGYVAYYADEVITER